MAAAWEGPYQQKDLRWESYAASSYAILICDIARGTRQTNTMDPGDPRASGQRFRMARAECYQDF